MDPVDLNKYLLTRSYLIGNSFTYADLTLFNLIHEKRSQYTKFTHVVRWLNHIKAIRNCTNDSLSSDALERSTQEEITVYNPLCKKVRIMSNGVTNGTSNGHHEEDTRSFPHSSHFPGFGTHAAHHGSDPDKWGFSPIVPPISLSTTFKQSAPGVYPKYDYSRAGNPTRTAFEECIARLEGGTQAMATCSGLAATCLIVNLLKAGDHILCCDDVYGGTNRYFNKVVARFGIDIDMVDPINLELFESKVRPNTALVWLETPTNPMLKICDIKATVEMVERKFAGKEKPIIVVDNTFSSPYFQRPLDFGASLVLNSVTKYINGHTDVCMGVIATKDEDLAKRLRFLQLAVGPAPSPMDCYLALRGARTLHLRMRQHESNSLAIAKWLETGEKSQYVLKVIHPGLPSHPQHELAKRQMKGFSGMLSFVIQGGKDEATLFLQSLKVFALAESLGGYESLAELPSVMTHASVPPEQRAAIGISDSLVRLSVGIEEPEDLIADLAQAFDVVYSKK
ncbi:hypothetical protein ACHWQZ_G016568 [Mnemiopsis leidyi]